MAANQKVGRVGKVYDLVGPSPSHSRSSLFSLSPLCLSRAHILLPPVRIPFSLSPCSLSLSPEPVAHKLIRSRCLLARDSHWPPVVTPLALFASSPPPPSCTPRPGHQDHPFSRSLQGPKYSQKLRDRTGPRRVNPGEGSGLSGL